MRKYTLACLLTIPILLLAWKMADLADEQRAVQNVTAEEGENNQAGILQGLEYLEGTNYT